jgi:ATP-dependent RNA circularization protein (DNA/RNA ligase family)
VYWKITKQEDIEKKLKNMGKNIAIQGEIIGEGVQKNKYKLKGIELYVFNVVDLTKNYYYSITEREAWCNLYGFKTAPYIGKIVLTEDMKVSDIIELSKGKSALNNKILREGIILRSVENDRISFKAINPDFLLKYDT